MNPFILNIIALMVLSALFGAALMAVTMAIVRRRGLRKLAASLAVTPALPEQPAVAPEMAMAMDLLAQLGIRPPTNDETPVADA
jgi:hypothetical protein